MIRRIDLRGQASKARPDGAAAHAGYRDVVPRADTDVDATVEVVRPILDAVRERGIEAVLELSLRFDGVDSDSIAVPEQATADALMALDEEVRAGLEESISRLRRTCEAELESDVVTEVVPGGRVTQRLVPVDRVGLYVPGGVARSSPASS